VELETEGTSPKERAEYGISLGKAAGLPRKLQGVDRGEEPA